MAITTDHTNKNNKILFIDVAGTVFCQIFEKEIFTVAKSLFKVGIIESLAIEWGGSKTNDYHELSENIIDFLVNDYESKQVWFDICSQVQEFENQVLKFENSVLDEDLDF